MYLFIFESIGTSELLLIGVIALIFLGPRRMPEIARKIGKIMAEFRTTTNEFKSTWEREVNFDEETNAFMSDDVPAPVPRITSAAVANDVPEPAAPAVTPADSTKFTPKSDAAADVPPAEDDINDRKNWL